MSNHPVAFVEVTSDDVGRALSFYAELFGWSVSTDADGYGLFDTGAGDDAVGGGVAPASSPGETGVTFYVRTDDLEGTVERAEGLGATTVVEPMSLPGDLGRIAVLQDPHGNPLGLWS